MQKVKFNKGITVLGFIAFALIILFIVEKLMNVKSDNITMLKVQGNAKIVKNQTEVWKADYDEFFMTDIAKGDVITVTMEVPIEQFHYPALMFRTGYNRIKVYQGEYCIYSYGELQQKQGAPIAQTQLIVPLNPENGNEISIEITARESTFIFEFPDLLLVDSMEAGHYKLTGNAVHTYLGLFLILFGVILFSFFVANLKKVYLTSNIELLILALYSSLGGAWMWSHYGILEMFWDNTYVINLINIISEFTMPILVLFFFYIKLHNEKAQFLWKRLAATAIIFVMIILLLLTIKRFYSFVSHIILWFYFILIITAFEWNLMRSCFKRKNKLNGFILASVISYYISVLICFYNLHEEAISFAFFHKVYCNTIVFVIVQMFLSYVVPMINDLKGKTEREVLIELAYVDGLTGLLNRNRSEEIMNQIRYDEENFYYAIEFELINLKKMNRAYGYVTGDQALVEFANCLKEAFEDAMLVSRYSGNEFIVILENENQEKLDHCMELFMEKIRLCNEEKEEQAKIQYVYGVGECNCMIKGHDIYKILRVAEKQKYEKEKQVIFDK